MTNPTPHYHPKYQVLRKEKNCVQDLFTLHLKRSHIQSSCICYCSLELSEKTDIAHALLCARRTKCKTQTLSENALRSSVPNYSLGGSIVFLATCNRRLCPHFVLTMQCSIVIGVLHNTILREKDPPPHCLRVLNIPNNAPP